MSLLRSATRAVFRFILGRIGKIVATPVRRHLFAFEAATHNPQVLQDALRQRLSIVFESDHTPAALARFIDALPSKIFGINYDIGNSASLGYAPTEEIGAYGARILNVHVKDRVRGGTTVPLGTGNADFAAAFRALRRARYSGNFILQTARAADVCEVADNLRRR